MKKDIVNLARFLLNDCDGCQFTSGILKINKGNIFVNITSESNNPEYLKLTVMEFRDNNEEIYSSQNYFNEIASQVIPTEEAKDLIRDIWKEIEKYMNKEFIDKYGNEAYYYYRNCYMLALKGETENELFEFSLKSDYDKLNINLKEKNNDFGTIYNTEIQAKDYRYSSLIHGAVYIDAFFPMIDKLSKKNYGDISIYIPIIDVENETKLGELLEINTKIKYSDNNIFDYIHTQLKDKESSRIINMFELQNDLNENCNQTKKLKL
jgi:hypothetical protein